MIHACLVQLAERQDWIDGLGSWMVQLEVKLLTNCSKASPGLKVGLHFLLMTYFTRRWVYAYLELHHAVESLS